MNRGALLDQVLAILRDAAPLPVGTHEIGERLGPYRPRWGVVVRCSCGHEHEHIEESGYERSYTPADVFTPRLRRLEKKGLVERIPKTPGPRLDAYGQDYWRYLGAGE